MPQILLTNMFTWARPAPLTPVASRAESLTQNWLNEEGVLDYYKGNAEKADLAMKLAPSIEGSHLKLFDCAVLCLG